MLRFTDLYVYQWQERRISYYSLLPVTINPAAVSIPLYPPKLFIENYAELRWLQPKTIVTNTWHGMFRSALFAFDYVE